MNTDDAILAAEPKPLIDAVDCLDDGTVSRRSTARPALGQVSSWFGLEFVGRRRGACFPDDERLLAASCYARGRGWADCFSPPTQDLLAEGDKAPLSTRRILSRGSLPSMKPTGPWIRRARPARLQAGPLGAVPLLARSLAPCAPA
jgi:hypothetical protein